MTGLSMLEDQNSTIYPTSLKKLSSICTRHLIILKEVEFRPPFIAPDKRPYQENIFLISS